MSTNTKQKPDLHLLSDASDPEAVIAFYESLTGKKLTEQERREVAQMLRDEDLTQEP